MTVPDVQGRDISPIPRHTQTPPLVAYLAGPMTGIDGYNFAAFNKLAAELRDSGYAVLNPAESFGGVTHLPRTFYLRAAVRNVLAADLIVVLPGWEESPGAALEVAVARAIGTSVKERWELL